MHKWQRKPIAGTKNDTGLRQQFKQKTHYMYRDWIYINEHERMHFVAVTTDGEVFITKYRGRYKELIGPFPTVRAAKAACVVLDY